jgi:dipeptidase E
MAAPDLFLMSSSRVFGGGYLEYAREPLTDFLQGIKTVHFVPYAVADHDTYTRDVAAALARFGVSVIGLHAQRDPGQAIQEAETVFVGGGNSFRLLKRLHQYNLVEPIKRRVEQGALRYVGSSAGTNMACPTLRTTNDMPIVEPPSFAACGLIPFQINPHYLDPDATSTHMGETRETRLREFLEENDVAVVGMREGSWLRRSGERLTLGGVSGARVFRRDAEPAELQPGTDVGWLLNENVHFDVPQAR